MKYHVKRTNTKDKKEISVEKFHLDLRVKKTKGWRENINLSGKSNMKYHVKRTNTKNKTEI